MGQNGKDHIQALASALMSVPGHKQPTRAKQECPKCFKSYEIGNMVVSRG